MRRCGGVGRPRLGRPASRPSRSKFFGWSRRHCLRPFRALPVGTFALTVGNPGLRAVGLSAQDECLVGSTTPILKASLCGP